MLSPKSLGEGSSSKLAKYFKKRPLQIEVSDAENDARATRQLITTNLKSTTNSDNLKFNYFQGQQQRPLKVSENYQASSKLSPPSFQINSEAGAPTTTKNAGTREGPSAQLNRNIHL